MSFKFPIRRSLFRIVLFCIALAYTNRFTPHVATAVLPTLPSQQIERNLQEALTQNAFCTDAFPFPPSTQPLTNTLYLPIAASAPIDNDQFVRAVVLPKFADLIVPLGDQLDDVGQYYSQAASSFTSTLHITNTTPISQPFSLTLYSDTGLIARDLALCRIEAQSAYAVSAQNGQLLFRNAQTGTALTNVCAPTSRQSDLHGIYHAQITTQKPDVIQVQVDSTIDSASAMIAFVSDSRYQAVANTDISNVAYVPAVLATRDSVNWWDTEIVVQNTSASNIELTMQICSDSGRCFQNNRAVLRGYERRSFLASHLLYENSAGFLLEHKGWYAITATAQAIDAKLPAPAIAVVAQIFHQPIVSGRAHPSAEQGSQCLLTASDAFGVTIQRYPLAESESILIRVFNPTRSYNPLTVQLVDQNNAIISSLRHVLLPNSTTSWTLVDLLPRAVGQAGLLPPVGASLYIQADDQVAAFILQDDQVVEPLRRNTNATQWFAPFIGFPVVDFQWDNSMRSPANQPGPRFGLGETFATAATQRPAWARAMNWYTWRTNREFCDQTAGDNVAYSTYIPMWWGLGSCSNNPVDRSCVNSEERLREIRNDLPSNCAGRPLFLANEPDLPWQGYMTYHELGRLIYVLRDWAGQLFSPTFASYRYDAPNRIYEEDAWCAVSYAQSCPGDIRCNQCVRDGVADGRLDPHDISFQGLENFFAERDRWARNQSWPFDEYVEGMNLHFYTDILSIAADEHWRVPYLHQYRDRADQAGWPIIVKEYGFITWQNQFNDPNNITQCEITRYLDNVRRVLQDNLGNYAASHNNNPFKLFWFHTGCIPGVLSEYDKVCLFDPLQPSLLSTPVGACWYKDATAQGSDDSVCSCAASFLPIASK